MSLGEDGVRRLTTFCGMSVGMSCFGAGCLTLGARTDNERLMPPNPDWMASGRQVKCAAGGVGDGDRITPTVSQGSVPRNSDIVNGGELKFEMTGRPNRR